MPPIPCAHCGTLFMRKDNKESSPKICNSCINKERHKNQNKEDINMMKILIECTPVQHAKIEEICLNEGKNFSEYFLSLHELNSVIDSESLKLSDIGKMHLLHEETKEVIENKDTSKNLTKEKTSKNRKK
jgi:hypothetical protein